MNEIWTVFNRDMSKEKEGKDLITMWWFLTIAILCYSRYCQYKFEQGKNIQDLLNFEYLTIILVVVSIHYLITLLKLITLVNKQSKL